MNRRKRSEINNKEMVVSEICIKSDNTKKESPPKNNNTQVSKKEPIFLTKKRERHKTSKNYFFSNNKSPKLNMNFINNFRNKGAFQNHKQIQFPNINNYFTNFQKTHNSGKLSQITLIINNYINIEKSDENIENKEKSFSIVPNSKLVYLESPSTSSSNSNQVKTELKEKFLSKNKFNVIKDNLEEKNENLIKFNISKKRGRKTEKIGKRQHSALDQDNIIRKIQVHFISFIIDFTNDIIQAIVENDKNIFFKSINYEYKKIVNHSYILNLFSKKIGEILQLKASPKNKKFAQNINKIIYEKLCNIEFFKKFFEISYLEMFNKFYYQEQREINVYDHKIKLSQRTKLFADLLEKNKSSSEKIKEIAEEYFVDKKNDSKQIFVIQKSEPQKK